ncbi:hypothetical protein CHS0354_005590 [Potamilus streckersoni]|uniref:Fibronectin type-III domain-containing protein n=1 Tax=Potamilus streckersoni TaxID=2493646 RepID=A0AAE0VGH9_9BIVA|nr:hypothetical protein CHS0354_005590 [Potamilus streckersoni]
MIPPTIRYLGILSILFFWPQIFSNLCQATGQNVSATSYKTGIYSIIIPKLNNNQSGHSLVLSGPNPRILSDVDITWVNSSTSSITIQWRMTNDKWQTYVLGSEVECLVEGGKFVSNILPPEINQFTIQNLQVGTTYTVCVRVFEQERTLDVSNASHSKCVKLETLNYVRKDSILWMSLIIGYYIFMGLLGYTQWRRKLCEISKISKKRNTSTCRNEPVTVKWNDSEERQGLMQPGCSSDAYK